MFWQPLFALLCAVVLAGVALSLAARTRRRERFAPLVEQLEVGYALLHAQGITANGALAYRFEFHAFRRGALVKLGDDLRGEGYSVRAPQRSGLGWALVVCQLDYRDAKSLAAWCRALDWLAAKNGCTLRLADVRPPAPRVTGRANTWEHAIA